MLILGVKETSQTVHAQKGSSGEGALAHKMSANLSETLALESVSVKGKHARGGVPRPLPLPLSQPSAFSPGIFSANQHFTCLTTLHLLAELFLQSRDELRPFS